MTTIGEKRVRVKFNPAQSGVVDEIKQKTAEFINILKEMEPTDSYIDVEHVGSAIDRLEWVVRQKLLIEIAVTKYEEAAMWAVKAATAEKE